MRPPWVLLLVSLVACDGPPPRSQGVEETSAAGATGDATCVAVHDGDTVTIEWPDGREQRVRLEGIDAPELDQAGGRGARRFLTDRALGRSVGVRSKEMDVHGRLVARLTTAKEDLSLALVEHGHAWHFTRFSDDRALADAERAARLARRGLWRDPEPTPPWAHREHGRQEAPPAAASDDAPFRGNDSSFVYHARGCEHFACRRCTVELRSRAEASERGFRPHRRCVR